MAVKANLGSSLTKIVIGVVALITGSSTEMVVGVVILVAGAIKIMEELVVFVGYKASKLEVFGVTVAIAITRRVGKGIKIIKQQW